jgi:hypothetical protein
LQRWRSMRSVHTNRLVENPTHGNRSDGYAPPNHPARAGLQAHLGATRPHLALQPDRCALPLHLMGRCCRIAAEREPTWTRMGAARPSHECTPATACSHHDASSHTAFILIDTYAFRSIPCEAGMPLPLDFGRRYRSTRCKPTHRSIVVQGAAARVDAVRLGACRARAQRQAPRGQLDRELPARADRHRANPPPHAFRRNTVHKLDRLRKLQPARFCTHRTRSCLAPPEAEPSRAQSGPHQDRGRSFPRPSAPAGRSPRRGLAGSRVQRSSGSRQACTGVGSWTRRAPAPKSSGKMPTAHSDGACRRSMHTCVARRAATQIEPGSGWVSRYYQPRPDDPTKPTDGIRSQRCWCSDAQAL